MTICGLSLNCWGPRYGKEAIRLKLIPERITLNKREVTCKNCLRCLLPHKIKITRYKNSCPPLGHICILELRNPYGQILATAKANDKDEVRHLRMAKKKLVKNPKANCVEIEKWVESFKRRDGGAE